MSVRRLIVTPETVSATVTRQARPQEMSVMVMGMEVAADSIYLCPESGSVH